MPDTWKHADLGVIRTLLSIVIVGFVLVGFALLLLRWPTAAGDQAVQQITRLSGADNAAANLVERLPDLAIYLILIAGIAFLALAWRRGDRSLMVGLIGVGFLGLAYAGGMALYIGPMVSVCGFMLILFGAMVTWATTGHGDAVEAEPSADNVQPTETADMPPISAEGGAGDNPGDVSQSERGKPEEG